MEGIKHLNKCSECEHFGSGRFPVVEYFVGGELKSKFIGFSDRPNGKAVEHYSHRCNVNNNVLCYDDSDACVHFEPKKWERPLLCRDCSCFKNYYDNDLFTCADFPFFKYHSNADKACPNGKCENGTQYTLFDFIE